MKTINEILRKKGYEVTTISPDDTVRVALNKMAELNVGSLVVMEGEKLVGIFSERDYVRTVIIKEGVSLDNKVADYMTRKVVCVTQNQTADEVMALMTDKRVRHLPVIDEDKLIGIISIGDLVKSIISDQKFVIEQLGKYITS
jgi:CBS domain-containing protein